jgi:hypothetical protein
MRDRRAVARYAGLTGSPDESGARRREQGLARAGNARVRRGMIQLAWRFLMFQKESALALWYRARTADSRSGTRKTMIVALARKLIIALWRFVTTGEPLEISCGAEVIARHPRSYEREDFVFDPLHYLALLERKIGALDQAAPLVGWDLPEEFATLRRLIEARTNRHARHMGLRTPNMQRISVTKATCHCLRAVILRFDWYGCPP